MIKRLSSSLFLFFSFSLSPSISFSSTFDTLDTLVGYVAETDASTTTNRAVLIQGEKNQSVQLDYNIATTGNFSQLTKNFSLYNMGDLYTPGTRFCFNYKGSGPDNQFFLKLVDTDGDKMEYKLPNATNTAGWVKVQVSSSDFTPNPGTGTDGNFDFFRVNTIELGIEKTGAAGSGSLDFDEITLIQDSTTTAFQILDNFNDGAGAPNALGGSKGMTASSSISTAADNSAGNVYEGIFSLKINYNLSNTTEPVLTYHNSPAGKNLSPYRQIEFYAKSSVENERIELAFGSSAKQQAIKIGGLTTTWKKYVVNFLNYDEVFRDGAGANSVTELVFRFVKDFTSNEGTLWVDDIRFVRPAKASSETKTIDLMEESATLSLSSWGVFGDANTETSLSTIDGVNAKGLRLTYDLGTGTFVGINRNFNVNAALYDAAQLRYKYNGAFNDLQFNMVDVDNVRFFSTIKNLPKTGGLWKTLTFPFANFKNESAANTKFNLKKISSIRLALVKDKGGTGSLAVDELAFINSGLVLNKKSNGIISDFVVENNPFSPNSDGLKDNAIFRFTLLEESFLRIRIYNQQGTVVKEIKPDSSQSSGASSLTWDGKNDQGQRVTNGLYFYQFSAESVASDGDGKLTNVIAVLR